MSRPKEMARYSFELTDEEKQRIESCRNDLSWQELSLSSKLRVLIFERVENLEEQSKDKTDRTK